MSVLFLRNVKSVIMQRPGCEIFSANVKMNSLILCTCHSVTGVQINVSVTCDSGEDNTILMYG